MALRDSRRSRARLLLFTSSIILGISALVAINTFGHNIKQDINTEAKGLLGADIELGTRRAPDSTQQALLDTMPGTLAQQANFNSVVLLPNNKGAQTFRVQAIEPGFPFYGRIKTQPPEAAQTFHAQKQVLMDPVVAQKYDLKVGDSIKLGALYLTIAGTVEQAPGQTQMGNAIFPPVFIPFDLLPATKLVRKGSRVSYNFSYKLPDSVNADALADSLRTGAEKAAIRISTVQSRKERLGQAYTFLTGFLNLVAFIALILGALGVGSAINIYVKSKVQTVALLRCLGASGRQAMLIFLIQICIMGFMGALAGALAGTLLQLALPALFNQFLPMTISTQLSGLAIVQGMVTGLLIAVLFGLLPLINVRRIPPLATLRASLSQQNGKVDPLRFPVFVAIVLLILGFAFQQVGQWDSAIFFTLFIGVSFGILTLAARLLMWLTRRILPRLRVGFVTRQAIANLHRPNNQTLILLVSIGLGTALISTLFLTQGLLLGQLQLDGQRQETNLIMYDVQQSQLDSVHQVAKTHNLKLLQEVPLVTMRISHVDGQSVAQIKQDTASKRSFRALSNEYRVSYRDSLLKSDALLKGSLGTPPAQPQDSIFISVEDRIARSLKLELGTPVRFNVQGLPLQTYVGSIREVNWAQMDPNASIIFPSNVLEQAPQIYAITANMDPEQAIATKTALVKAVPNISMLDLGQLIRLVGEVVGKIAFVIQFMALFSIVTGLLVLIGSVVISKFQRIRQSVLLRTLGASRKQVLAMTSIEYILLGSLAALTGTGLSVAGAALLAEFVFEIPFTMPWLNLVLTWLFVTVLTLVVGLLNIRSIVNHPPLQVLRQEL